MSSGGKFSAPTGNGHQSPVHRFISTWLELEAFVLQVVARLFQMLGLDHRISVAFHVAYGLLALVNAQFGPFAVCLFLFHLLGAGQVVVESEEFLEALFCLAFRQGGAVGAFFPADGASAMFFVHGEQVVSVSRLVNVFQQVLFFQLCQLAVNFASFPMGEFSHFRHVDVEFATVEDDAVCECLRFSVVRFLQEVAVERVFVMCLNQSQQMLDGIA